MNLEEALRSFGVTDAHIVDDAFDTVPGSGVRPQSAQTFIDGLNDIQFTAVATDLGDPNGDDEWVVAQLATLEGARRVFLQREKYGTAAAQLFEEFLLATEPEKARLQPLLELLHRLGVKYHTFGRDYDADTANAPQLLFVDLKLNEREIRIDDPIRVVEKLMIRHPDASPLVFLISTLKDALNERRSEFRDRCKLFTTQFETLSKQIFQNEQELRWFLDDHIRAYPVLRQLQQNVTRWGQALDRAKEKLQSTLRCLDLADYFVLYQNTVTAEQVPLGTYMTDLLLEYVAHQVEGEDEISKFAQSLDTWKVSDLTRSRFNLQPIVGDIFSANVLHAMPRLTSEAERGRGPQHGFFQLGDIFFPRGELERNHLTTAVVVLTPACDLVRPETIKQRRASILLCEGEVEPIKNRVPQPEGDTLDPVILRFPAEDGVQYAIHWQKKRPRTWKLEDLEAHKNPATSPWTHAGRLRPLYALQLQHMVTSDLSRIGVQRTPAEYRPCGIEVLVANQGKWKLIKLRFEKDPAAGAVCDDKATGRMTMIVSDSVLRRVRAEILRWVDQSQDAHATAVGLLFKSDDVVRALMFFSVSFRDDDRKSLVVYPLKGMALPEGLAADQATLIGFARQDESLGNPHGGGKNVVDDAPERVVLRFIRISD
jgi:hypothetical protein